MTDVCVSKPSLTAALALAVALAGSPAQAGWSDHGPVMQMTEASGEAAAEQAPEVNSDGPASDDEAPSEAVSDPQPETASEEPSQPASDASAATDAPVQAPVAPRTAEPVSDEKPLPPSRPDYYTERAKQTVEQDGKSEGQLHALQKANPDHNVVVCEGGCPSEKSAQIVFIEPRAARKAISSGEMIPNSSEASAKSGQPLISCEAGCYESSSRSYQAVPGGVARSKSAAAAAAASNGSWVTTVTPAVVDAKTSKTTNPGANGSGDWMKRISKETGQKAPVKEKPVAKVQPTMPVQAATAEAVIEKAAAPAPEATPAEAPPAEAMKPSGVATVPAKAVASDAPAPAVTATPVMEERPAAAAAPVSAPVAMAAPAAATPPTPEQQTVAPKVINEAAASEAQPATSVEETSDSMVPTADQEPAPAAPVGALTPAAPVAVKPTEPLQVAELTKPDISPAAASASEPVPVAGTGQDPVVRVETGDNEMEAAIGKARSSLPEFWSKLENPGAGETDFSLKVAIEGKSSSEVEHFWLTNIERRDGKITGIINNTPETVKSVHVGQVYEINPEKISDWLYKRKGKMVGNETMRPLLKRLPAEQAASYRQMYEAP